MLLPGRCFFCWGGYSNLGNYPPALRDCGLYFSQAIVWDKQHPVLARKDFMAVAAEVRNDGLVRALEAGRAPLSEQVVALGIRLPDPKAKRGWRKKTEAALASQDRREHLRRACPSRVFRHGNLGTRNAWQSTKAVAHASFTEPQRYPVPDEVQDPAHR